MKIAELVAELGFDMRGEANLRRFEDGIKRAESRLTAFTAAAAKWGAVAGAAIGAGLAGLAKSVISTTAQFEQFEAALETIEGSAEKARESMEWISRFARQTPYDLAGVTEAFTKLKTYGMDPLADDALRVLGDTASAMNKPLNQAVEALADATTFQFERLREFGLVASQKGDQVTFKWQRNGQEMTRIVKKNGEEIRRFLLDNFGERFSGAMLRQSSTWNGMVSNLGDTWEQFKVKIGRGGFFDAVKSRLGSFLDKLDELDANGTLDQWSERLGRGFTKAVDVIEIAFGRLVQIGENIAKLFGSDSALWGLTAFASAVIIRAFPLAAGVTAIVLALEDLWGFFEGKDSMIGDWLKDHPRIEAALRAFGDAVAYVADALGPLLEYAIPVLGFTGALVLLVPALKAVSSALLTFTGIKLAWGVIAWLAALAGVGKSAAGIAALGTAAGSLAGALARLGLIGAGAAVVGGGTAHVIRGLSKDNADEARRMATHRDAERESMEAYRRYKASGEYDDDLANRKGEDSGFSLWGMIKGIDAKLSAAFPSLKVNPGGVKQGVNNVSGHMSRVQGAHSAAPVNSVLNDSRDQSSHVEVNVGGVHVQQAVEAPAAAGKAVGDGIAGVLAAPPARRIRGN